MTPLAADRLIRIEQAKHLLRTTRRSATQIADDTGFCDLPHLIRVFRAAEGTTPDVFRRSPAQAADRAESATCSVLARPRPAAEPGRDDELLGTVRAARRRLDVRDLGEARGSGASDQRRVGTARQHLGDEVPPCSSTSMANSAAASHSAMIRRWSVLRCPDAARRHVRHAPRRPARPARPRPFRRRRPRGSRAGAARPRRSAPPPAGRRRSPARPALPPSRRARSPGHRDLAPAARRAAEIDHPRPRHEEAELVVESRGSCRPPGPGSPRPAPACT